MSRIVLYIILTAKINFVIYYFFSSMSKKTQSAGLYVKNQHTQDGNKNRTQTYNDTLLTFFTVSFLCLEKIGCRRLVTTVLYLSRVRTVLSAVMNGAQ